MQPLTVAHDKRPQEFLNAAGEIHGLRADLAQRTHDGVGDDDRFHRVLVLVEGHPEAWAYFYAISDYWGGQPAFRVGLEYSYSGVPHSPAPKPEVLARVLDYLRRMAEATRPTDYCTAPETTQKVRR